MVDKMHFFSSLRYNECLYTIIIYTIIIIFIYIYILVILYHHRVTTNQNSLKDGVHEFQIMYQNSLPPYSQSQHILRHHPPYSQWRCQLNRSIRIQFAFFKIEATKGIVTLPKHSLPIENI